MLYGLVHQRYILTRAGLQAMVRVAFWLNRLYRYLVVGLLSVLFYFALMDLLHDKGLIGFDVHRLRNMKTAYLDHARVFIV